MNVYQLKLKAHRGLAFGLAVGMFGIASAAAVPAVVHADALNPLTERTLLLSSSSPGDHYLDAAGNETYAQPGSGPNGKKTGETFSFKVSTNSTNSGFGAKDNEVQAFTFQYCITAAGSCSGPGDGTTNLNAHYGTAAGGTAAVQNVDFEIWAGGTKLTGTDWVMTVGNKENIAPLRGANNFITLKNNGSTPLKPAAGTPIKIVFKASATNYITNPKSGAFFVRINDYSDKTDTDPTTSTSIIDGGVTVANVMTDSIEIRTKVLETMSFSVGTTNPDTVNLSAGSHGPCDAIAVNAPLYLGNPTAEYSLEVAKAYDTHSYWRLSSNSSNGASVYYSGYTLSNTVGDQIDPIGTTKAVSHPGMEQFGLAFTAQDTPRDQRSDTTPRGMASTNTLSPLIAQSAYANGGGVDPGDDSINITKDAEFAFDPASDLIPALLATENTDVVGCTTGKMRYIGNIAAVTPAGIYASKVNYLAAPQY